MLFATSPEVAYILTIPLTILCLWIYWRMFKGLVHVAKSSRDFADKHPAVTNMAASAVTKIIRKKFGV